ncbi:MAG: alginate lyase family protein [Bacteroidaceae bacterium]|nr:alginate lyase family protein [Bacteroidaceae bacterium]
MKRLFLTLALLCAAQCSQLHLVFGSYAQAQAQTDRGFVHPGGLHTQADFDRVKAQLAAGNKTVKAAYQKLTGAAYSQSGVQTNPVEVIVRGGGQGENYINACRGATMAYQNALRWKLAGSKANANAAVRILMAWANTTKDVSGDSNYALASGLYGYQFAQAAELMRDYEGWAPEDFERFKQWMLSVWYSKAIGFLRGRNGTWENAGKWWQAPGHYWSNWGLCNALCVSMIGILCDDVFLYNQGMSYFKYDQCGTFTEKRSEVPIKNDGLTEFLGNLVVTTTDSELETGAYGQLGQMNESGRDTGHSAMALGLAIDLAKVGWNQGDDLFAYMNHRLAAGIEYVAAQTQSIANLPWVNYQYGSSGYYYSDARAYIMDGPALGAQMRPYWGSVIGIYEGVKGVRMPFSEVSYQKMGIDGGGEGGTSGGYDHLGYSVLMNTRDEQLCPPDRVPTELSPRMEYSGAISANLIPSLAQEKTRKLVVGKVISHNELGGLVNTFTPNNNTCVPPGKTLKLMPQLPEGEEDTGNWRWNNGEQTRDITVQTDSSFIYRVTYTNKNGVESHLAFAIAVDGDCTPDRLTPRITYAGNTIEGNYIEVLYGKSVTLAATPSMGWGTFKWSTKATTESITRSVTADAEYTVEYRNQGGAVSTQTFQVKMVAAEPYAIVNSGSPYATRQVVAATGSAVTLGLTLPTAVKPADVLWSDGTTGATLTLDNVQTSGTYSATFMLRDVEHTVTFDLYVKADESAQVAPGTYLLRHIGSDTYLTAHAKGEVVTFEPRDADGLAQLWTIEQNSRAGCNFVNRADGDSLLLSAAAKTTTSAFYPLYLEQAVGTDRYALHTGTSAASYKFWDLDEDGALQTAASSTLQAFPFQLIAYDATGVGKIEAAATGLPRRSSVDLSGRPAPALPPQRGVYIVGGRKILIK